MKTALVAVIIIGLLTVIITIAIGTSLYERTVVPDPYETGLHHDEAERARSRTGWHADILRKNIRTGADVLTIEITDRNARRVTDAKVVVKAIRPFMDENRHRYEAVKMPDGRYRVPVELRRPGRWEVEITVSRGEVTVVLDDAVHVMDDQAAPSGKRASDASDVR